MKKLTLIDFQNRLDVVHPKENLRAIEWNGGKQLATVKCLTCNKIYSKNGEYFLDKRPLRSFLPDEFLLHPYYTNNTLTKTL